MIKGRTIKHHKTKDNTNKIKRMRGERGREREGTREGERERENTRECTLEARHQNITESKEEKNAEPDSWRVWMNASTFRATC